MGRKWTCNGVSKNSTDQSKPHKPLQVPEGEECIYCGLTKNEVILPKSSSSPVRGLISGLIAVGFVAIVGFAGYSFWKDRSPSTLICLPSEVEKDGKCIAKNSDSSEPGDTSIPGSDKCTPKFVWQDSERFSSGERTLFTFKGNLDRDRGIDDFKLGNYKQAIESFEKAVASARNDPEIQIYRNNAKARLNCSRFAIAVVIPVNNKATSAEEILRGVADAQTEFNDSRDIGDRLLEIIIVNDGNEPPVSTKVAKQISNNTEILGVIGHNSSDASGAALPSYEAANLTMISPTSTSTSLEGSVFFRTVPSDTATAKKLGKYAKQTLKINNLVIFYDSQDSYSLSILQAFKKSFTLEDTIREIDLTTVDLDVEKEVNNSIQEQAKAVVLFPGTKTTSVAIRIAKKINKKTSRKMKLLGGDALYNPDTLIQGGNAIKDLVLAVPLLPSNDYSKTAATRWGGKINWRTASSYDAADSLIQVIKDLDDTQNVTRKNVLKKISSVIPKDKYDSKPYLVQAVGRDHNISAPQGSEFGFKEVHQHLTD